MVMRYMSLWVWSNVLTISINRKTVNIWAKSTRHLGTYRPIIGEQRWFRQVCRFIRTFDAGIYKNGYKWLRLKFRPLASLDAPAWALMRDIYGYAIIAKMSLCEYFLYCWMFKCQYITFCFMYKTASNIYVYMKFIFLFSAQNEEFRIDSFSAKCLDTVFDLIIS